MARIRFWNEPSGHRSANRRLVVLTWLMTVRGLTGWGAAHGKHRGSRWAPIAPTRRAVRAIGAAIARLPRWAKIALIGAGLVTVGVGSAMAGPTPLTVAVYQSASHRYFSPDGDGQDDTLTVYYCLSASSNVTIDVTDPAGHSVRTMESGVSHQGSDSCPSWNNAVVWDGRDDAGVVLPGGVYTVRVRATDGAGQSGEDNVQVGIDTRVPGALTSPSPGDVVSGTLAWTFTPAAGFGPDAVGVYCDGAWLGSSSAANPDGTFTGSGDTAPCAAGANSVVATASWTDPFGYRQAWTAPAVSVTVNNVPGLRIYQPMSHRYFSPDGDGQDDAVTVYYCLSKNASVTTTVIDGTGATVRTIAAADAVSGYPNCPGWNNSVTWDGRDDGGVVLPGGVYTVRVRAVDAAGQTGQDDVQVGIDTRSPGALTSPRPGDVVSGTLAWTFAPTSGFGLDTISVYCDGTWLGSSSAANPDGTFTGSGDTASCLAGTNPIVATASWTDPFGYPQWWTSPPVSVTVNNVPGLRIYQLASHRYFSPDGDGQDDSVTVLYCLSKDASVTTTVTDAGGAAVRTIDADHAASGYPGCPGWNNSVVWDGRDDGNAVLPGGVYTMHVRAVDAAGQSGQDDVQVGIDTRTPGALTSPAAGDVVSGTLAWTFTPTTGFGLDTVSVYCDGAWLGSSGTANADGTLTGSGDSASCRAGTNPIVATASWTDPFGYPQWWTAPTVSVTVNNAPDLRIYQPASHRYFSPDGDGQDDSVTVLYCLSRDASVTTTVTDAAGATVRTIAADNAVSGYPGCPGWNNAVAWDGRDDGGVVLPGGVYTVRVRAVDPAGQAGQDDVQVGIDTRRPGTLTSPAPGDTLAGLASFAFQPTANFAIDQVGFNFDTGGAAYIFNPSPDGAWRTTLYTGTLHSGPAVLQTYVTFTDAFGASHAWAAADTPVVIDATGLPLTVSADPASGPAPLGTTLHIATSDPHAGTVHYSVNFGDGSATVSGDVGTPYPAVDVPHSYTAAGAYRAVVTVTNSAGAAATRAVDIAVIGTSNTAPTASLALDQTSGTAPLPVQAGIGGTDADNDHLTYRLDFGDGTIDTGGLPHADVPHSYAHAGTYLVRLAVSDGRLTAVATGTVIVALAEPLAADAGDDQVAVVDTPVRLDGSASRPSVGIETYHWTFGDGAVADGAIVQHGYPAAGSYTATLTVTAGGQTRTDTTVVTVTPTPQEAGLAVTVTDGSAPISGASVVVIDAAGQRFTAQTGPGGVGHLSSLPDGRYTVYGWSGGFLPATATATVASGTGAVTLNLKPGQVAEASLTSAPLTLDEIIAAGIDPDDPANQNVYEFTIDIAVNSTPVTLTGYTASGGFPLCPTVDGVTASCNGVETTFTSGGYSVSVSVSYVHNAPQLVWLVIPVKASWLKEFFAVQMAVTNLADPGFVLDHGTATLDLPAGLSLAPTASPQRSTTTMADIDGGKTATATWLVRGDTEGFYNLTASYAASLEPFGDTVTVDAASAKPLHVWGGSAIEITIDVDQDIYDRYPYHVRVGLKNVADVPIYNASVELLSQAGLHYLYQPREALRQGTAQIDPGSTFWTDDYILAPDFTGSINLASSFVELASGTNGPTAKIVSHTPVQTPQTAPVLTATGLHDHVGLLWTPVPGATGYEIYATPDRSTDFPATPVLAVPAGTTSATLPLAQGDTGWFAVSSIINGRRTLVHPITQAAPSSQPAVPSSHGKLSTATSCGADIGVSVQFSDPFFDLTGWTATLGGTSVASGGLTGREAATSFLVKAADVPSAGALLTIRATDSQETGAPWTGWVTTSCSGPIHMLVLGDSIAWGQGLLDEDKYPSLVATALNSSTHRPVVYSVDDQNFAHSGAVVTAAPGKSCNTDLREDTSSPAAGEVPLDTPDIGICQVAKVKNMQADLILVDGCINDIDPLNLVFNIALDVSQAVREKCNQSVKDMLSQLHQDHPDAQIIYTGYYRIIGDVLEPGEVDALAKVLNLTKAEKDSLRTLGDLLQSRSAEFDSAFKNAANTVVNSLDITHKWLKFADPGFQPSDGLFGTTQKVFGIDPLNPDPMFTSRALACFDAWHRYPDDYKFRCPWAAVGHPNEEGAKLYAAAIMNALHDWAPPTPTLTALTVSPAQLSLPKGDSKAFTVTATYANGTTADASTLVTSTSNNASVATVDNATTTVKAVGVGTAQITVTLKADPTIRTTMTVTVTAAVPRTLTLTPANQLLLLGKSLQLTATITMSDGTSVVPTKNLTWSSSNTAVATVSAKGVVKGVAVGTVSITATYKASITTPAISGSTTVTVTGGTPQITGFSPASGPVGTVVTIQGSNLLGVLTVTFGGVAAQFTINSSSSITAVVPPKARTGVIEVTFPSGAARSKTKFTVR
jgi:flagellar hook assembly protein FlgD/PKD repeat protein